MKPASAAHKKYRLLAIIIGAIVLAGAGIVYLVLSPNRLSVGIYDIDAKLSEKIKVMLDAWAVKEHVKIEYKSLAAGALDAKAVRKTDCVFLHPSMVNSLSARLFTPVDGTFAKLVARGVRTSATVDERQWALPLLVDTKEYAWKNEDFGGGRLPKEIRLSSLADVLSTSKKKTAPLMVAPGGSDAELLDIAGLCVIERGGIDAYKRTVDLVLKGASYESVASADLGGFTIRDALSPLVSLQSKKLVHINWLDLKGQDVAALVESGSAVFSLQTLSLHRAIRRDVLAQWSSAPIINVTKGGKEPVVSAAVLALASAKPFRQNSSYAKLCGYLVSADGQRALQQATNLAPAIAAAPAVDIQASEARAAASGAIVVQGLSRDAFTSDVKRNEFAQGIRAYLRSTERRASSKPAGERKQP
jgi:hypothetical protein